MGPCVRRDDDEVAEWLIFVNNPDALCREKGEFAADAVNHSCITGNLFSCRQIVASACYRES